MRVTLPPCPCPICGNVHPAWMFTSAHSVHGAGRGSISRPIDQFKLNMTAKEIESSVYGPLWESLIPGFNACKPLRAQHLDSIFYRNRGFGQTDVTPSSNAPSIITVAPTDGSAVGWAILGIAGVIALKKLI